MDWKKLIQTIIYELEQSGESNSCIITAAVLIKVLRLKGIKGAYPLTVRVKIFNPKYTDRINKEPPPNSLEVKYGMSSNGWALVAIGGKLKTKGLWPAHLIVIIPQAIKHRDALCDLTITQANKPEWNISLAPIIMGVNDSFIKGYNTELT